MAIIAFPRAAVYFENWGPDTLTESLRKQCCKTLQDKVCEPVPKAKNPDFQDELVRIHSVYRYIALQIIKKFGEIMAKGRDAESNASNSRAFVIMALGLALTVGPLLEQIGELSKDLKRFEERIVELIEQESPAPEQDLILQRV
jgi:hypothetical protein